MNNANNPEDIPRLFVENWNARRADLMAELFNEDADFINVVGIWWQNRKDIFKAHDYGLKVIFKDSKLRILKQKVKYLSDNIAVVHTKISLEGQSPNSGESGGIRYTMLTFIVEKKSDGYWSAVSAQNTDVVIGAETNIRTADGTLRPADYRTKK